MSSYTRLLRRQYTGNLSLTTTDHCRTASFLPTFSMKTPAAIPETKRCLNGQFLLELGNVLSPVECTEAIRNAEKYIFENMNDKYRFGRQRKSSRLLALDRSLAENLWEGIKDIVSKEMEILGISKQPHGFDVTRGEWQLHGLNEAMRINKYSGKKEYFGPHKDAQYCPNGDERSIFTLLVYLNDHFKGGETCFYFPKNSNQCTKGMTIKEEIEAHGGLKEGYVCVEILPKAGHAVISSQDILHEALPVMQGTKYILKTDVVVKRHSKQFGFAVQEREKEDHATCLNFFREAQQNELQGNFDIASDLYEKALSIRYCYPQCLEECEKPQSVNPMIKNIFSILPWNVWYRIFQYLPGYDAQQLVYAYPELNYVKATWEQRQANIACHLPNEKYFPKIKYQKGVVTCFEFPDAEYFRKNMTGCVRVVAMYSFFLFGHKQQDDVYTVKYNPDTEEVCVVALETLLADVFYGRRCYGSFYNVRQQDPERKDPRKDFEASVDRSYMLMQHGAEFTGMELPDSFYVKSAVYLESGEEYEDSDDNADKEESGDENAEDEVEECGGNVCVEDNGIGSCGENNTEIGDGGAKWTDEKLCHFKEEEINGGLQVKCKEKAGKDTTKINEEMKERSVEGEDRFDNVEHRFDNVEHMEVGVENETAYNSEELIIRGLEDKYQKEAKEEEFKDKAERSDNETFLEEKKFVNSEAPNETKKKKESCNGVVPFFGEINESFPVDSLLRYLLTPRPGNERLDYEEEWGLNDEIFGGEDQVAKKDVYFDYLNEIQDPAVASAARVAKLDRTLSFYGNDICICFHGPEEETIGYVQDHCSTQYFNHQVFDFKNCQLSVTYSGPESFRAMVIEPYRVAIAAEMAHPECTGEAVFCDVSIKSLLSSDTSFNHASCQCGNPSFDVHEYFNIKDYPGIDTICIIAKERSEKMIVWAIYDGVVAL